MPTSSTLRAGLYERFIANAVNAELDALARGGKAVFAQSGAAGTARRPASPRAGDDRA